MNSTNRTDDVGEVAKLLCKLGYIDKTECLIEDVEKAIAPLIASAITSAVEAERARCAKLARDFNDGYSYTGKDIAKAIEQTPTQEGV